MGTDPTSLAEPSYEGQALDGEDGGRGRGDSDGGGSVVASATQTPYGEQFFAKSGWF